MKNNHTNNIKENAVQNCEIVTYECFYKTCEAFDWHWHFSDDPQIRNNMEQALEKIRTTGELHEEFKLVSDGFSEHYHSGEIYGNQKKPKPQNKFLPISVELNSPIYSDKHGYLAYRDSEMLNSDIWDNSKRIDGHYLISEIDGDKDLITVCKGHDNAIKAAKWATNQKVGGFGSVEIRDVLYHEKVPPSGFYM
jgi:hypothetical protein